jgi:type IV pilus assembly protein PilB
MPKNPNRAKPAQPQPSPTASKQTVAQGDASLDLDPFVSPDSQDQRPLRRWHQIMGKKNDTSSRRIGERMIRAGLIEEKELNEALDIQKQTGRRTVDTLFALGYVRPVAFCEFAAKEAGVAAIDLKNYMIPSELKDILEASYAEQHEVVPLGRVGRVLTLAMACPFDQETVREVEQHTGLNVCAILCQARDIRQAIHRLYQIDTVSADT